MGNACGTPASGRERVPEPSALDALISEKVKDYTRRHPVEASKTVNQVRSIHWSPYDRAGVVNADP